MRAKISGVLTIALLTIGPAWAQSPAAPSQTAQPKATQQQSTQPKTTQQQSTPSKTAPPTSQPAANSKESEMDIRMSCEKFAEDDHIPPAELGAYMAKCMQDLMSDPSEQSGIPPMDEDLATAKPIGVLNSNKVPTTVKPVLPQTGVPAGAAATTTTPTGGTLTIEKIPIPVKSQPTAKKAAVSQGGGAGGEPSRSGETDTNAAAPKPR
ncbi:MAG: hypothetical protein HQL66_05955 [Magnetococcales bacterium]|nr:hypothetical protein [Magnetococcales bacterium]